jgi:multiple sugar transport system substrate-binding protein
MEVKMARTLTRRQFLNRVGIAVGGAAALTASDLGRPRRGFSQKKPVNLRMMWVEALPLQVAHIKQAVADYKTQSGVDVEISIIPAPEIFTKLQASIATGQPYDLAPVIFSADLAVLVGANQLVDLTDMINRIGKNDFGPYVLYPVNNRVYWFPYNYNVGFLYVRKDWLDEKGLKTPRTWDEELAAAKALTGGGRYGIVLPYSNDSGVMPSVSPIFWGNGMRVFDNEFNIILDSAKIKPRAVESLKFFAALSKHAPPGMETVNSTEMMAGFHSGVGGMFGFVGRVVHLMAEKNPSLLQKYDVCPLGFPTPNGQEYAGSLATKGFVVTKGPNAEEASRFLEWWIKNKYIDFILSAPVHLIPTLKSVMNSPKYRGDQFVKENWRAVKVQLDVIESGNLYGFDTEGPRLDLRPGKVHAARILNKMMQKVILSDVPPERAVDDAAKEMRDLIRS